MKVVELLCFLGLVVPAVNKRLGLLPPNAAATILADMPIFSAAHLASSSAEHGQPVHWLVFAAKCGFPVCGKRVPSLCWVLLSAYATDQDRNFPQQTIRQPRGIAAIPNSPRCSQQARATDRVLVYPVQVNREFGGCVEV